MLLHDPTKECANLTAKLITAAYKSKAITFRLDENPLQRRVYFLSFLKSIKFFYHNLHKHTCFFWTIHP